MRLAVAARQSHELALRIDDEHTTAGDRGALRPGHVDRPQTLAALGLRGDHAAGMADGEHGAVVDSRARRVAHRGQLRGRARARQVLRPDRRAVRHLQRDEIAGWIRHDDDVTVDGRAGVIDEACLLRQAAHRPELAAVGAGETEEAAVERNDEHAIADRRRRGAHRRLELLLPDRLAGLRIDRDDVAVAARRVKSAAVDGEAAAVAAAAAAATERVPAAARTRASASARCATPPTRRVGKRADRAFGIECEDAAA